MFSHKKFMVSIIVLFSLVTVITVFAQTEEESELSLVSADYGEVCEENFAYLNEPFTPTLPDQGIFFNIHYGGIWTAQSDMKVTFIAGGDARIGEYRGFNQLPNYLAIKIDGVAIEESGEDESLTIILEEGTVFELSIGSVYDPENNIADQVTLTVICQKADD